MSRKTFNPVIDFLLAAARDSHVLAIKQPVYGVGHNTPVVEALLEESERGKQVAVLVELKARFDEENNIGWAQMLEQAGVKVDLLVRGMCCLKPGIKGVSDKINVVSIVGRYLEHSRVYYFCNKGEEQIYMGSADLMRRNLDHRVEIVFPVERAEHIHYLRYQMLATQLKD